MHHFTWKWLRCHYAHAHSLWNYLKHFRCLEEWHIVKAFFVNIIISVSSLVHQHRTYIPDMMLLLGEVFVSCVVSFMGFRLYPVGFSTCGFIQYITSTLCEWTQYIYMCVFVSAVPGVWLSCAVARCEAVDHPSEEPVCPAAGHHPGQPNGWVLVLPHYLLNRAPPTQHCTQPLEWKDQLLLRAQSVQGVWSGPTDTLAWSFGTREEKASEPLLPLAWV